MAEQVGYEPEELIQHAVIHFKKRRYATAQLFWCVALENYIRKKFIGIKRKEPEDDDTIGSMLKQIKEVRGPGDWYSKNQDMLWNFVRKRNDITHRSFISEEKELKSLLEGLVALISGKTEELDDIIKRVDPELTTRLGLKFHDRTEPDKELLKKLETISADDFNRDDYAFSLIIWRLKEIIDNILKNKASEDRNFKGLTTGLVSEFTVSSDWIWLPVGFGIEKENKRVKKPIISVMLIRNRTARVYLDFGTEATPYRRKYYSLLQSDPAFKDMFRELCDNCPDITEFFNVEHYTVILEQEKIPIGKWLKGDPACCESVSRCIRKARAILDGLESQKRNEWRDNVLLFGRKFNQDYFTQPREIESFASDIINVIELLLPFLKAIEANYLKNG